MKTAVMLLAHGTKEPVASEPVHQYARALSEATGQDVFPCLREFIEPSMPTVVEAMMKKGYERVVVLPFFLFKSGHVTRGIAQDLTVVKGKYPNLIFEVGEPIGYDESMVSILQKRLSEVLKTL